jgi:hypothetical protein
VSKALDGAERKGREAAIAGKARRSNPYGDVRSDTNMVTFSRAFQRRWFEGFDKATRELPTIAAYHGDVDGDGGL